MTTTSSSSNTVYGLLFRSKRLGRLPLFIMILDILIVDILCPKAAFFFDFRGTLVAELCCTKGVFSSLTIWGELLLSCCYSSYPPSWLFTMVLGVESCLMLGSLVKKESGCCLFWNNYYYCFLRGFFFSMRRSQESWLRRWDLSLPPCNSIWLFLSWRLVSSLWLKSTSHSRLLWFLRSAKLLPSSQCCYYNF